MKSIVLLSGGLDSTVSFVKATRETEVALALTFDYGQRAAQREIEASKAICEIYGVRYRVIELPWLGEVTTTALVNKEIEVPTPSQQELGREEFAQAVWVPNRNGVFVAIGASIAEGFGCELVVGGFNLEEAEAFPDNSPTFIEVLNQSLKYSTLSSVKLVSFVSMLNKKEIASLAIKLSIPLEHIWCCYEGGKKMCGVCESCQYTIRAFKAVDDWSLIKERFKISFPSSSILSLPQEE